MNIFFEDATIWVLVSFGLFVALAFAFGRRMVIQMLDDKILAIRTQIANAEALREEAQKLLLEYETKQKSATAEAQSMLETAKRQAEDMHKRAEQEIADTMQRREAMLKDRIQRMEDSAMEDIRRYAAELAVSATTEIITQNLGQAEASKLADQSIRKVAENLN